jgi:hypothetical protein
MATQTQKGKAFEYACLKALNEVLEKNQGIVLEKSSAYETARGFYESLDLKTVEKMNKAAKAAVKIILRLEPQLENDDDNAPLFLQIQEDAKGIAGDVRDVVCIRKQNGWEIGLSCKHNHTAVKHSRLSNTIDFGAAWFDKESSNDYFLEIQPIFDKLNEQRTGMLRWSQILNKDDTVYVPVLDAFIEELKRLDKKYPEEIPTQLVRYLLGRKDFYKVITQDSKKSTTVQAYNLFGTLNKASIDVKSNVRVHQLKLPTKFYDISYKENSKNTIIVTCDGGWALSFRIHNASMNVEPSLKFDVQLIGVPQGLHTQIEPWE